MSITNHGIIQSDRSLLKLPGRGEKFAKRLNKIGRTVNGMLIKTIGITAPGESKPQTFNV